MSAFRGTPSAQVPVAATPATYTPAAAPVAPAAPVYILPAAPRRSTLVTFMTILVMAAIAIATVWGVKSYVDARNGGARDPVDATDRRYDGSPVWSSETGLGYWGFNSRAGDDTGGSSGAVGATGASGASGASLDSTTETEVPDAVELSAALKSAAAERAQTERVSQADQMRDDLIEAKAELEQRRLDAQRNQAVFYQAALASLSGA